MAFPTIKLSNERQIIVVSGFDHPRGAADKRLQPVVIDKSTLEAVAATHKDAVAFGYVRGHWFPAA